MKKRTLTPDEKKLWKFVTRNDRPLVLSDSEEEMLVAAEKPEKPPVRKYKSAAAKAAPKSKAPPATLGSYAGVDRSTADRFRKGARPIDATLDLHGMSREKAHTALVRFIKTHYEKQNRFLLVITGKGLRTGGEGVLRQSFPLWLALEEVQPMVLAFDVAQAKHGGSGAYYVLLKRKR